MLADAEGGEKSLKRTLGAFQLVALGVGAIIGAGLFVRTAAAAAEASGNGVPFHLLLPLSDVLLLDCVTQNLQQ